MDRALAQGDGVLVVGVDRSQDALVKHKLKKWNETLWMCVVNTINVGILEC